MYFLQQVSKVDPLTSAYIVGMALLIATPTLIFYGWLSDLIGRKPVMLAGFLLAALTYYPLYSWLGEVTRPGNIDFWVAVGIIAILVSYVGMVYGPIGAFLAEYFPSRIRYTSVSVPYHIGNGWGGGLVPFITTAAFQGTGSLGYALIYPIAASHYSAATLVEAQSTLVGQNKRDPAHSFSLKLRCLAKRPAIRAFFDLLPPHVTLQSPTTRPSQWLDPLCQEHPGAPLQQCHA